MQELAQARDAVDKRLAEKEEEFENTRKNHARALESMQVVLFRNNRQYYPQIRTFPITKTHKTKFVVTNLLFAHFVPRTIKRQFPFTGKS